MIENVNKIINQVYLSTRNYQISLNGFTSNTESTKYKASTVYD